MTTSKPFRRSARAAAILVAALAGCAAPAALAPPRPAGAVERAAPALQTPEFVAVVVQPGESLATLAAIWLGDATRAWEIAEYNGVTAAAPGLELVIPLRPFRRGGLTPERYQTVPVLTYHHFAEKGARGLTVSRDAFEAQMRLLKEKGYQVVSIERLLDFLDFRGQLPEKAVVIAIDDGWRSAYDIAFPILKKHGYPATLFISTQLITGGDKTLSWDQVREMSAHGLDVQCHTISHRNLARALEGESPGRHLAAIAREIAESTRVIERQLGKRPTIMAYPYGETSGLVIALLKKHGYRAGLTVAREANPFFAAPFRLSRSMIYGEFDLAAFEINLVTTDRRALR